MRYQHYLLVWVFTQEPCSKEYRCHLTFAVARGNGNGDPVLLAFLAVHQQVCQVPVVRSHLISVLHRLTKFNEIIAALLRKLPVFQHLCYLQQLFSFGVFEVFYILKQEVQLFSAKMHRLFGNNKSVKTARVT